MKLKTFPSFVETSACKLLENLHALHALQALKATQLEETNTLLAKDIKRLKEKTKLQEIV